MRVKLTSGGREVEVDVADDGRPLKDVMAMVLELWTEAKPAEVGPPYAAFGYQVQANLTEPRLASGHYGRGHMREVTA